MTDTDSDTLPPDAPDAVTYVLRPMRGTDIEHVGRIERASFPTSWSTNAYVTELANPNATYLVAVARAGGREAVVGYAGLWVIMDEAHITTIAVSPEQRGKRIGERLLSEMLYIAHRKGATRATLEVRSGNASAQRLYERYGFVWVAVRKGYYSDNGENADILWINDMDAPEWREPYNANREELGLPPL